MSYRKQTVYITISGVWALQNENNVYKIKTDLLSEVVSKLGKISKDSSDKVLFNFSDNKLQVSYATDDKKSTDILNTMGSVLKPIQVAIVLTELSQLLGNFKSALGVEVPYLQLKILPKKLEVQGAGYITNGNTQELNEEGSVLTITKDIGYIDASELTRRDAILNREDFNEMLHPTTYDVWDKSELHKLVKGMLDIEGSSIIYSTRVKCVFSTNQVYSGIQPVTDETKSQGWILSSENAKAVLQVLDSIESDNVYLSNINNSSVQVTDTDGRSAFICELTVPSAIEGYQFNALLSAKYKHSLQVQRKPLLYLVANNYQENKKGACVLQVTEDGRQLILKTDIRGGQREDTTVNTQQTDEDLRGLKLGLSSKYLKSCLAGCTTDLIELAVSKDDDGIVMVRITDTKDDDETAVISYYLASNI